MRKITAGLFITLDGVVEAPEKWSPPYYDDEMGQAVMPQQMTTSTPKVVISVVGICHRAGSITSSRSARMPR
jgi:hypothetical protein